MMDNLPVIIANVQELDALCRAWLGYDSAVVERLEAERDYLLAELGRMSSLADEYRSERDDARAVVEAGDKLAKAANAWWDEPEGEQWSMDTEIMIHEELRARTEEYDAVRNATE